MNNVMAALPNIGGALCSTPQVWLTPTTRVPCSNAANIAERKTWRKMNYAPGKIRLGGKVWLTSVERHLCSKSQIPLRYPGRRQVRNWLKTISELEFRLSSSSLAAS